MRPQLLTCDYGVRAMKSKLGTSNGGRLSLLRGGGRAVVWPQVCHVHVVQPGALAIAAVGGACATRVNELEAMALEALRQVRSSVWSGQTRFFHVLQQKQCNKEKLLRR